MNYFVLHFIVYVSVRMFEKILTFIENDCTKLYMSAYRRRRRRY